MALSAYILMIGSLADRHWTEVLMDALGAQVILQMVEERDAIEFISRAAYNLIIIDADAITNVPLLISRINAFEANIRIIVASASPTWTRAREAIQSGAIDYIKKTFDRRELLTTVQEVLIKEPLPRS